MNIYDPICGICGEPRSAHVPTEDGPLSHPREARGEGRYEKVHDGYTMAGCMGNNDLTADDIEIPPLYRFVPKQEPTFQWDWRPSDWDPES